MLIGHLIKPVVHQQTFPRSTGPPIKTPSTVVELTERVWHIWLLYRLFRNCLTAEG